jgi:hypothetical protein
LAPAASSVSTSKVDVVAAKNPKKSRKNAVALEKMGVCGLVARVASSVRRVLVL